jgi:hypothetical protein
MLDRVFQICLWLSFVPKTQHCATRVAILLCEMDASVKWRHPFALRSPHLESVRAASKVTTAQGAGPLKMPGFEYKLKHRVRTL